jgi:hypothetical protein
MTNPTGYNPHTSAFCPGGGYEDKASSFKSHRAAQESRRALWSLIGVYSGRDNISLSLSFDTAQKLFQASDYVLAYQPGGYVVDGQNRQNISGPARCNDNFGIFNCNFGWNPIAHRMELFTKAPLQEGLYEVLVNYNEPRKSSVYWTQERLSLLPPDSRKRCIAYYRTQLP